jgi:hypothetical protein
MNIRHYIDQETNMPHMYRQGVDEGEGEDVKFPPGRDEERVRRVIAHCEERGKEEAVAEDEATLEERSQTLMEIPNELVPVVRELIAKQQG